MIDFHKDIVTALNTILPTHYEMTLTSATPTPCISYMELGNISTDDGNTIGYSRITYQVKVWGNDIAQLQQYSLEIDATLHPLGWKRVGANEMYDRNSTMIQKILTYECLALENY